MAETYVGLIRGINVGRAKRVAMADLRALVEELGYGDVKTFLNSGNVVFTSARPRPQTQVAAQIEKGLSSACGVSARVIVLSGAELDSVVQENPLTKRATDPSRLLVAVLADPADKRLLGPLTTQDWAPESLAVGDRAAYAWCPKGILESRLPDALGRALGDAVTTRNWSTIQKIHAHTGA
ncbi:MAG TPA: DUF1697 domain-containing protein [Actinomycetota bacterium]|nr:DUF1697 domain-containing protein [Actinomycetota bacterium]